ncbi:uroporphyrinogen-III synthase [Saccharicrinis sp. FJH54]|uniref:uroporphyrinogen-III synthase n=1 Tax=Saccharicrinis sp. FJH54 TaxID=3344665 RepID=UPI0035D4C0E5
MDKRSSVHSVSTKAGEKVFISTRAEGNSEALKPLLSGSGYELLELPLIQTVPVEPDQGAGIIPDQLQSYSWLVFTSSNGVKYFFDRLKTALPSGLKTAVIGDKTAEALKEYGTEPDFISNTKDSVQFAKQLKQQVLHTNDKVLWSTGKLADQKFTDELDGFCSVTRLDLYNTISTDFTDSRIKERVIQGHYKLILFYSPSAVHHFATLFKEDIEMKKVRAACIGKVTAKACRSHGIEPLVIASEPKSETLIEESITYNEHKKQ